MDLAMELTLDEYYALLRNDLYTFITRCFAQLNPGTRFMPNWHLELVASILADGLSGKTPRVIINIPPRYLKINFSISRHASLLSGT